MSSFPVADTLRVLRFPNLVVVVLTQLLVYYRVLTPALAEAGVAGALTMWRLAELVIITLAITVSGYLINDIQDIRTDEVNRPGTNALRRLEPRKVYWYYVAAVLVGFMVSQLLAYRTGERALLWIYSLAVTMLAVYSVGVKRIPVLGNLLVALYCAGVPGVLLLAERRALWQVISTHPETGLSAVRITLLFMAFAFLATLLRELVKDLEDLRGDAAVGRRTIPVRWGTTVSHRLCWTLGLGVAAALVSPFLFGWSAFVTPLLMLWTVALVVYLGYVLFGLTRSESPRDYHRLSTLLKAFLFGGLGLFAFYSL